MKSHQLYQTVCLVVLCILGVILAGQLSSIEGRYSAAESEQNAVLDRAAMLKTRGEARIAAGDLPLGIEYLSSALSLNAADDALRTRLAELQAESILAQPSVLTAKNALNFHALFHQVIEVQGGKTPISIRIAYGKTLSYRGLTDEAKSVLDEAIKLAPDSADALLFRADVHLQESQWQAGLDQFNEAAKLNDKNPLIHFGRGVALMQLKKYEEAIEPLKAAAPRLNTAEPWVKLAVAHAQMQGWEEAELAFARAELLKPNSAKINALYATVLAKRGRIADALQAAATRAQATGDPASYLQMGNWYLDLKKYEQAAIVFNQLSRTNDKESEYDCKSA